MVRVIIIEDEESISDLLQLMLVKVRPEWVIEGVFKSVQSSSGWLLRNKHPDLIFMDIQLSDGVCFSIFEKIEIKSMVIFTTAYDKYAIKAFEVNSIDYLLKPMKQDRLLQAIAKFENFKNRISNESIDYDKISGIIKNGLVVYRTKYLIRAATSYYTIFTDDIAYFYIENRVLFAVTPDKKEHIIDYTMEEVELQLDPNSFFRINRSYLVHNKYIQKFENYFGGKLMIYLKPPFDKKFSVSRLKATDFKNWMGK